MAEPRRHRERPRRARASISPMPAGASAPSSRRSAAATSAASRACSSTQSTARRPGWSSSSAGSGAGRRCRPASSSAAAGQAWAAFPRAWIRGAAEIDPADGLTPTEERQLARPLRHPARLRARRGPLAGARRRASSARFPTPEVGRFRGTERRSVGAFGVFGGSPAGSSPRRAPGRPPAAVPRWPDLVGVGVLEGLGGHLDRGEDLVELGELLADRLRLGSVVGSARPAARRPPGLGSGAVAAAGLPVGGRGASPPSVRIIRSCWANASQRAAMSWLQFGKLARHAPRAPRRRRARL